MKTGANLGALALAFALGCGGRTLEEAAGSVTPPDAGAAAADAVDDEIASSGPNASDAEIASSGLDASNDGRASNGEGGTAARPGVPTVLASMQTPSSIAVDATTIYWSGQDYALRKIPIGGGSPTTLLSTGSWGPIAVDGTSVYFVAGDFADIADITLSKIPLGGGAPAVLVSESRMCPEALRVDATSLYWIDQPCDEQAPNLPGTLMKASLDGGAVTTLASAQNLPSDLVVWGPNVYWTTQGTSSCSPSGVPCGDPGDCSASNSTCEPNNDGTVMKVAIGGGTPITLASGAVFWSIAASEGSLFYVSSVSTEGMAIQQLPMGGGLPRTIATATQTLTIATNSRSGTVDWVDVLDNVNGINPYALRRAPLSGGAPSTLATITKDGESFSGGFAVDGTHVYWGTSDGACTPIAPDGTSTCLGALMQLTTN